MHRVTSWAQAEAIGEAFRRIPELIRDRLEMARFFCGDPISAGLHRYEAISDGRSYRNTAHALYPAHLTRPAAERVPTIALPSFEPPEVIVHELGHLLDWTTDFEHQAAPMTWYAETNREEAFAEAFTAWIFPDYLAWGRDDLLADRATVHLFESLAGGRL